MYLVSEWQGVCIPVSLSKLQFVLLSDLWKGQHYRQDVTLPLCFSSDYIVISPLENPLDTFPLISLPSEEEHHSFLVLSFVGWLLFTLWHDWRALGSSLLHLTWLVGLSQRFSAKLVGTLHISWINMDPSEQILSSLLQPH